jgi:DNA-directed RNA polymerase subunit RPC12/RpoP
MNIRSRRGNRLDGSEAVQLPSTVTPFFPCPFCRSRVLLLIGGTRFYLYYRCGECSEVWTVTDPVPSRRRAPHRLEAALAAGVRH